MAASCPEGAATAATATAAPAATVRDGMALFRAQRLPEALAVFDALHAAFPQLRPTLWQRGLSLFYAGRFEEGAAQFRCDVAHNGADAEEALWAFLCEARGAPGGFAGARANMLAVGEDPRPVLRVVLAVFRGAAPLAALRAAGAHGGSSAHDRFYAALYEALFLEVAPAEEGGEGAAREALARALASAYATGAARERDYMVDVAAVHAVVRGWAPPPPPPPPPPPAAAGGR